MMQFSSPSESFQRRQTFHHMERELQNFWRWLSRIRFNMKHMGTSKYGDKVGVYVNTSIGSLG